MLASTNFGFLPNFCINSLSATSIGRLNNQQATPSASIFLLRKTDFMSMPISLRLALVIEVIGMGTS